MQGSEAVVGAPGRDLTLADGSIADAAGDVVRLERRGERWRSLERHPPQSPHTDRLAGSCVAIDRGMAAFGQLLAEDVLPLPGEAWVFTSR
jgi:hypothetical protein